MAAFGKPLRPRECLLVGLLVSSDLNARGGPDADLNGANCGRGVVAVQPVVLADLNNVALLTQAAERGAYGVGLPAGRADQLGGSGTLPPLHERQHGAQLSCPRGREG